MAKNPNIDEESDEAGGDDMPIRDVDEAKGSHRVPMEVDMELDHDVGEAVAGVGPSSVAVVNPQAMQTSS